MYHSRHLGYKILRRAEYDFAVLELMILTRLCDLLCSMRAADMSSKELASKVSTGQSDALCAMFVKLDPTT